MSGRKLSTAEYLDESIFKLFAATSQQCRVTERMLIEVLCKHLAYVIVNGNERTPSKQIEAIQQRIGHYILLFLDNELEGRQASDVVVEVQKKDSEAN